MINSSVLPTSALPAALPSTIVVLSMEMVFTASPRDIFPEAPTLIVDTSYTAADGWAATAVTRLVARLPKSTLIVWPALAPI